MTKLYVWRIESSQNNLAAHIVAPNLSLALEMAQAEFPGEPFQDPWLRSIEKIAECDGFCLEASTS